MKGNKLQVSEIFRSIQGESLHSGLPCTFVRLAGCNLHCRWCDSRYAARAAGFAMDPKQIIMRAETYKTRLVCITGGEPLLQPEVSTLAAILIEKGYQVSVETNGSLDISALPREAGKIMDIKCPSSGQCGSTLTSNLSLLRQEDNVKFVIADREDFLWAIDFIEEHKLTNSCPVLFSIAVSPCAEQETVNIDSMLSGGRRLARWILESGAEVRLQLQLHKILWPKRNRGV